MRAEGNEGDKVDDAVELRRRILDDLDNCCNGLTRDVIKMTLEAEQSPDFLRVRVEDLHFKIINCGAYATGPSGVTHSNACFYLAATAALTNEGTENPSATRQPSAALALKVRLAELADQQPHDGKNVHAFNGKSAMAEWPVFMAFARFVGPITVYSVPAGARIATSYTWAGDRTSVV